jgi:hypothetical protein
MRHLNSATASLLGQLSVMPRPARVLTHRLLPGALLPTVPVVGLELTYPQVASALFEAWAEQLADMRFGSLMGAVTWALREIGLEEIQDGVRLVTDFDTEEFPEAAECQYAAYRLCLAHWYLRATCRPLSAGETAVCLYLGHSGTDEDAGGSLRLPASVLVELGEAFAAEFADRTTPHSERYRRLFPNRARRASCWQRALRGTHRAFPLLVRPDTGAGLVYGQVPPPPPVPGTARPVREGW